MFYRAWGISESNIFSCHPLRSHAAHSGHNDRQHGQRLVCRCPLVVRCLLVAWSCHRWSACAVVQPSWDVRPTDQTTPCFKCSCPIKWRPSFQVHTNVRWPEMFCPPCPPDPPVHISPNLSIVQCLDSICSFTCRFKLVTSLTSVLQLKRIEHACSDRDTSWRRAPTFQFPPEAICYIYNGTELWTYS